MKKLIITLTIAAFTVSMTTFADEAKKECPASKHQCSGEKKACCAGKKDAKCASKDKDSSKAVSPKAQQ